MSVVKLMLESLYRFCRFFGRAERKKEEKKNKAKTWS